MKLKFLELCCQQHKKEEILPAKHYSMKEVYKRIQNTSEEKPITIQDLKMEVNALKVEIKHLQIGNIAVNTDLKRIKEQVSSKNTEKLEVTESSTIQDASLAYLNLINKVTF